MNIIQSEAGLKIPPNSDEAEAAVLGAMMVSADAAAKAMAILVGESFYRPVFRTIYEAMVI